MATHPIGRDAGIGLFVAGKKTTRHNGATRFIPGSHLWDYSEGPPRDDQTFYAELEPGDAFLVLSGCYHAGSANKTQNEERLVFSCFFTRGWMRQEENQVCSPQLLNFRITLLLKSVRSGNLTMGVVSGERHRSNPKPARMAAGASWIWTK